MVRMNFTIWGSNLSISVDSAKIVIAIWLSQMMVRFLLGWEITGSMGQKVESLVCQDFFSLKISAIV